MAAAVSSGPPTVQGAWDLRKTAKAAGSALSSAAKSWLTMPSASQTTFNPEAVVSPLSELRKPEYWNDLTKLLAELARVTTVRLQAYTDNAVVRLQDEIRVDDVLYSNTSRRLRADMRIDRERFGRLRDGTR